MKSTMIALGILLLFALSVSACDQLQNANPLAEAAETSAPAATVTTETTPPEPSPPAEPLILPAVIESLEIVADDQAAGEITVKLRGVLPNGCAQINDVVSERDGNSFTVAVSTIQQPDEVCTQALVPFEEMVVLDVAGLDAGTYSVTADERQVSFELAAAEPPQETIDAEEALETPQASETASVAGIVWHDSCANISAEGTEPPAGCVLTESGVLTADGALQDEQGIAGVEVAIGEGECPAEAVDSLLTDANGRFAFGELAAASYCLFVDMTKIQNQGILQAGSWTAPAGGPQMTVTLNASDSVEDANFGWDFLDFPAAEETSPVDCKNSFEFVEDLTIPDDTAFPPGEAFTKQWLLRNNGTCTWSTEYSVLFVGGDQMSAEESQPLDEAVAPGETLEVAIDMVAPLEEGTYRGNWQIADPAGEPFGIDGIIEDAFWLQIVVAEDAAPLATPLPNSASLGGVVWDDACLNSDPGQGCLEFPEGSGIFIGDGTFSASEAPLEGILIALADGACATDGTFPADSALRETTLTAADGRFSFTNLDEGAYCLFMDALNEEMLDLLIPGNWTWPGTGVGQYAILLDPGEAILDLDFGWDYVD